MPRQYSCRGIYKDLYQSDDRESNHNMFRFTGFEVGENVMKQAVAQYKGAHVKCYFRYE